MRVWDVLRAIKWLGEEHGLGTGGVTLFGRGENGIIALYAALLDTRVSHVVLRDPPRSHCKGPVLPTILRDTDIEEIAGLLAPRRLTLLGDGEDTLHLTREWYQLAGASDNFRCQPSLAAALQTHGTTTAPDDKIQELTTHELG